ncbi:HK97 gp10 family phage protein [Phascolarctobacterium faecium]|uniref:HK97 gp10 family phage protein n=1 Tax=Phascolarctobacterium faecium TaxID=33025 RepID=UPI003FD7A4CF
MKMSVAVDIKTVKAIMQNHKIFDQNVQKQLEKITNRSLGKISRGAKQRVSSRGVRVNSGGRKLDLKSRITVQRAKLSKGRAGGIVWSKAPHSHLVEFGTKSHILVPEGKTIKIGDNFVSGPIKHPGSKPKPFLQPAYLQERKVYIDNIKAAVRAETEKKR